MFSISSEFLFLVSSLKVWNSFLAMSFFCFSSSLMVSAMSSSSLIWRPKMDLISSFSWKKSDTRIFYYSFKFLDDDSCVSVEFVLHGSESAVLEGDELVQVDEVISQSHLVLFIGFIEIFVQHLKVSFLGVELTGIVLGIYLDFVAELFGLGDTHDVSPIG
jgi:hypothetical protein